MATQNRANVTAAGNVGHRSHGTLWFDIDCSAMEARLKGVNAAWLSKQPQARKSLLHRGLEARTEVRNMVSSKLKSDPREAVKGVALGLSWKTGNPVLYINLTDNNKTERRAWTPVRHPAKRGGNRRKVSDATARINSYYGRSRAFILRMVSHGAVRKNRGSIKGRSSLFYTPATRSLKKVADGCIEDLSKIIVTELER